MYFVFGKDASLFRSGTSEMKNKTWLPPEVDFLFDLIADGPLYLGP
jgi:hypothetical protein